MTGYRAEHDESPGVTIETARAGPECPRFGAELVVFPDRNDGQLVVTVNLSRSDLDGLMSTLAEFEDRGYSYPTAVREDVLSAVFGGGLHDANL